MSQMRYDAPAIVAIGKPPFEDYSMENRTYKFFQGKCAYGSHKCLRDFKKIRLLPQTEQNVHFD